MLESGLHILDISDPTKPGYIGFCSLPDYTNAVQVVNKIAYTANLRNGLRIIDVSDPYNPFEIAFRDGIEAVYGLSVSNNYVYLANLEKGVRVFDVTNPMNPIELDTYSTTSSAEGVYADGQYIYVADGAGGISILENTSVKNTNNFIVGDVNNDGKVNALDALIVLKISVGLIDPTPLQISAGDVNNDGIINSMDAIIILQMVIGDRSPEKFNKKLEITISGKSIIDYQTMTLSLSVDNPKITSGGDILIKYNENSFQLIDVLSEDDVLLAYKTDNPGSITISFATSKPFSDSNIIKLKFSILNEDKSVPEIKIAKLYGFNANPIICKIASLDIPPKHSMLFQNFPNPFNPETWIPYQINEDCEVSIKIYKLTGEMVRELKLGNKHAGIYTSKDKSAYWDGKDETGVPVASGIYFYCIKAGNFTDVRKMIILK